MITIFFLILSIIIFPGVTGVHQAVRGYVRYSDGSNVPNDIIVTITDLNNSKSMQRPTQQANSGPGVYILDVEDLEANDGDTIFVNVSYGGCNGNNTVIINVNAPAQYCNITISGNLPPTVLNKPSGPTTGYTNEPLTYSTLSNDPDTPPDQVKYGWDWNNDNNVDEWTDWHNYSETCNITHYWQQPGTYTIKVKAQDIHGAEKGIAWSDPVTVTISNRPSPPGNKVPEADFTYTPSKPLVNVPVNFTDTSIDDGYIVSWHWNFGDGTNSKDQNTTHTYSKTGDYSVNLTVTDNQYAIDSKTLAISVIQPPPPPPTWKNTTEITLQYNERNKGSNYIVWKGDSITASYLVSKASLSSGDTISIFSKQLGDWQTYIVGKSNALTDDFLISPWDIIIIKCTSTKKILTDISKIDETNQTIIIGFTSAGTLAQKGNQGYNFFAWTQNHILSVKEFINVYGFSNESIEISKYNVDSNTWSTYNPSLPSEFQDQFTIQVFDIICIKVAQNTPEKELKIT